MLSLGVDMLVFGGATTAKGSVAQFEDGVLMQQGNGKVGSSSMRNAEVGWLMLDSI